jgi:hypothetical protein
MESIARDTLGARVPAAALNLQLDWLATLARARTMPAGSLLAADGGPRRPASRPRSERCPLLAGGGGSGLGGGGARARPTSAETEVAQVFHQTGRAQPKDDIGGGGGAPQLTRPIVRWRCCGSRCCCRGRFGVAPFLVPTAISSVEAAKRAHPARLGSLHLAAAPGRAGARVHSAAAAAARLDHLVAPE